MECSYYSIDYELCKLIKARIDTQAICFELENIEFSYFDQSILKIEQLAIDQFERMAITGNRLI